MGEMQRSSRSVTETTRLPARGSTTVTVVPPAPCGLGECVAELHVTIRSDMMRVHLDDERRRMLIEALGGWVLRESTVIDPVTSRWESDAAQDEADERPMHYCADDDRTACGKFAGMVYQYAATWENVTCPECRNALVEIP